MEDAQPTTRRAGRAEPAVVAVVAAGGGLGALARYAVQRALPTADGGVPWSTLLVNASGCLLIGVVVAVLAQGPAQRPIQGPTGQSTGRTGRRLARPFLTTGVLGGYTTFSAYALDAHALLLAGRAAAAAAYLAGTLVAALLAVEAGLLLARAATGRRPRRRPQGGPA